MTIDGVAVYVTGHAPDRWKQRVGPWPGFESFAQMFAAAEVLSFHEVRHVTRPNPECDYFLLEGGVLAVTRTDDAGEVRVLTMWRFERPNWVAVARGATTYERGEHGG